jgi:hypothetical protein
MSDEETQPEPAEVFAPGSAQPFVNSPALNQAVEVFVTQGLNAITGLTSLASSITKTLAIVGGLIVGVAMLLTAAALSGTEQWVVLALLTALMIAAVVAPVLTSFRLKAVLKHGNELVGDLKVLAGRMVDVYKSTGETFAGAGRPIEGGVVAQYGAYRQQYQTINSLPDMFKDLTKLAPTIARITSLPTLFGLGLGAILLAALTIPVLLIVWIA